VCVTEVQLNGTTQTQNFLTERSMEQNMGLELYGRKICRQTTIQGIVRPIILTLLLAASLVHAEEADLAKQLANPIASLISVPIQSNLDFGIGPGDGTKWTTNIQPVIPFDLNDQWSVISRTILPVIDQEGIAPGGATDAFGLGDTVQSLFFSPKSSDLIWGVGPVFLIPTSTDDLLGSEQWGIGPTAVVLKQFGPWTCGALANHLWNFAGEDDRDDVNATFLQPFVSYITVTKTTYSLNLESTYDWEHEEWNVPVNVIVSQLLKIGDQPVQIFGGVRYYLDAPDGGPEWGLRFGVTFLFPKS
jgi:hypothetical protein